MTSTPLDRFKHVLATICIEHPEMGLEEALLLADEIDGKLDELPLNTFVKTGYDPQADPVAWVRANQTRLLAMPKIYAIKETRAETSLGLKDAKDLVESLAPGGHWPGPVLSPAPRPGSGTT